MFRFGHRLPRSGLHTVIAVRGNVALCQTGHTSDIGDKLPNLITGYLGSERRHPVWPSLDDRLEDICGIGTIDPLVIHEGRAHSAASEEMASLAVVGRVQPFSFIQRICVFGI